MLSTDCWEREEGASRGRAYGQAHPYRPDRQEKSDASRAAMEEWYMTSWKVDVSAVIIRSRRAFSSVNATDRPFPPRAAGISLFTAAASGSPPADPSM